jgi:hypothetical protein
MLLLVLGLGAGAEGAPLACGGDGDGDGDGDGPPTWGFFPLLMAGGGACACLGAEEAGALPDAVCCALEEADDGCCCCGLGASILATPFMVSVLYADRFLCSRSSEFPSSSPMASLAFGSLTGADCVHPMLGGSDCDWCCFCCWRVRERGGRSGWQPLQRTTNLGGFLLGAAERRELEKKKRRGACSRDAATQAASLAKGG